MSDERQTDSRYNKDLQAQLEKELSELLTDTEIHVTDEERRDQELEQLSGRYEIRVQTQLDPIMEETRLFRSMGREVDDRYDEYLKRSRQSGEDFKPSE